MRLSKTPEATQRPAIVAARDIEGPASTQAWQWRTASVVLGVLIFTLVSLWAYLPFWELALRSDKAPLAWLSSALLLASAALAWAALAQRKLSRAHAAAWVVALVWLALDEQFIYHEYWKHHCAEWTSWCARARPGHVHWLGDAPMALVGIVGVWMMVTLYRVVPSRIVRGHLMAALIVGLVLALGTHFAHLSGALPTAIGRWEELFEVLAEALFLCALVELNALPLAQRQVQSSS